MNRRALLIVPLLSGCSVLPDRPYIETRRYALDPERPSSAPRAARARGVLLVRTLRAGPGMETRGLRLLRPDGTLGSTFYDEWLAPPAELAENALRQWLIASGIFTAVTAPGSRLTATVVLEAGLVTLQAEPGQARAAMSALLLGQASGIGDPRVLAQRPFEATSPLPPEASAVQQAAAMQAALGVVFTQLERWIASNVL
ncbi:ABC-type transport auxiliary lipoprotein family protein [Roseococcus sp. YIM B11640]|uniref:ABC-type transport auxiliary lipoprotein family protein n=1 Tax=Roseococcus sp. YIM B11640 TaxID=3133973 RepID=UPI003C7C3C0C